MNLILANTSNLLTDVGSRWSKAFDSSCSIGRLSGSNNVGWVEVFDLGGLAVLVASLPERRSNRGLAPPDRVDRIVILVYGERLGIVGGKDGGRS